MKKAKLFLPVFLLAALLWAGAASETLVFPADTEIIMEEAFAGDENVGGVILPPGLREIGRNAFRGCGFDAVYLPPGLETLGENAFDDGVRIFVSPGSRAGELLQAQGRTYTEIVLPETISVAVGGEIPLGGQRDLIVTVEPSGADTEHLIWSVSDPKTAALSGGAVEGLTSGTAVVRAEALNGVSAEIEVTVHRPVCRALLVANVNYTYMSSSEYCRWNAGDIRLLENMFGTVYAPNGEPWQTTVVYDQYASRLQAAIGQTFADTQEGDISLIHISSHGYNKYDEGNYRAVGVKMSSGGSMTYISYAVLKEWTDRYIRGDVILILEACYSGGAIAAECGAPFRAEGYYVLASCGYEEHCYSHDGNHNYFVEWLADGVKGMKADTNGDGALSLGELQAYILNNGRMINVGTGETYYQHSQAYPAGSDYILFIAR